MALPTKEQWLAGFGVASAGAAAALAHILDTAPDLQTAEKLALDYLAKQFAPEVILRAVNGIGPELVAAFATGQSEVRKSLADLA